jgi:hypothetical protein
VPGALARDVAEGAARSALDAKRDDAESVALRLG